MIECRMIDSRNIEAVLLFKRDQLIYDIRNVAFVEGDILEDEPSPHSKHLIQDIGEDGNIDRVTRTLNLAHGECVEMLFPFTKRKIMVDCLDDRLVEKKVYSIFMTVPKNYSQTTLNVFEDLVHEYLVSSVLADWLSITNPSKAATWEKKKEDLKMSIKSKVRSSRGRYRLSRHPFA